MPIRTTSLCLLAAAVLTAGGGCSKAPTVPSHTGTTVPFQEAGEVVSSSGPASRAFEDSMLPTQGILRSSADAEAARVTVRTPFDWSRQNVLFIRVFVRLQTIHYSDFRIVAVTRDSNRLVVHTRIAHGSMIGQGGATKKFHAVIIPATDLPVVFEPSPGPTPGAPLPSE